LWLSPTQVRIISVKPEFLKHCEDIADNLTKQKIRADIDDRNESVGKRIRDAEIEWIRYILVIGEKEINSKNLSVRDRETGDLKEISYDNFVSEIKKQISEKPFAKLNFTRHVSKRPQIMA